MVTGDVEHIATLPTFIGFVKGDTGDGVLTNAITHEPMMLVPTLVLSLAGKDGCSQAQVDDEGNSVAILLQPSSSVGLFLRLAEYFDRIGFDPFEKGYQNMHEANDKAEQYIADNKDNL